MEAGAVRGLGVVAQILRIAPVDVRGFAVGDEQYQALGGALLGQVPAGMAQGRAHAGGKPALQSGQPGLGQVVMGSSKSLMMTVPMPGRRSSAERRLPRR